MDPLTLGLLGAQAAIGLTQTIAGAAQKRQKINTAIQPEYKQAENILQNAAQSTSAAYDVTRKQLASGEATQIAAAQRGATGSAALLRAQQMIGRSSQSALSKMYTNELSQKSQELRDFAGAKLRTAGARERMQNLENQLAIQENAYKDQLIQSGLQNVFGAITSGVSYGANMEMLDKYAQIYGMGGQTPGIGGQTTPTFPTGMTTTFGVKPPTFKSTAIQPSARIIKPFGT